MEPLNIPYPQFPWVLTFQTSHMFAAILRRFVTEPHALTNELLVTALSQWLPIQTEKKNFNARNRDTTRPEVRCLSPVVQDRREMAHSYAVSTKAFLQLSPDTSMLFSPTSSCPTPCAHTERISQAHCWKWHHEAKKFMLPIPNIRYYVTDSNLQIN